MDTRTLIELIRSRDALPDNRVAAGGCCHGLKGSTRDPQPGSAALDQERELLMAEAQRLQLEAGNRELLARCDCFPGSF
jgi:hypothetical protein